MIEGQKESISQIPQLKYAMIGGGPGSFIGDVHRKAIAMDGKARLVAGCFSRNYEDTLKTGETLRLDKNRLYRNYEELLQAEARHPDRPDFIVIVTPNDSHYPISRLALELGFPVACDKPLATSSSLAQELADLARQKDLLFCVTYTYSGFPIIKHLRWLISQGELGSIRFVAGEYPQEWLATLVEKTGQRQAAWRTDPVRAGISNCVGDIGTHLEHMVSYLTGLEIETLCARLDHFGEGRPLDDNASIMINFKGGATGLYWCSQIAIGHDNGFRVRIYGTRGAVEWYQEDPNHAKISYLDRPVAYLSRGRDPMCPRAQALSRIPSGHNEGYFEAFANIYSTFLTTLDKKLHGQELTADDLDFPQVEEGVRGVKFIEKCVESSEKGAAWVKF